MSDIPEGWVLVKVERLDAIKKHLDLDLDEAYRGRGLYEERILIRNMHRLEESLDWISDEITGIEWDKEELQKLLKDKEDER